MATFDGSENDVRFLYSAACICYILDDWSAMNKEKAAKFILKCLFNVLNIMFDYNYNK